MEEFNVVNIARGLLDKADEDLELTRLIVGRRDLRGLVLFHLEQASEKILKAYFLGTIVGTMEFLYRLSKGEDRNRFPRPYRLIVRAVREYSKPKSLGHDFTGFLDKYLPALYREFCYGKFRDYIVFLFRHRLVRELEENKGKLLSDLVKEGLPMDEAQMLIDGFIRFSKSEVSKILGDVKCIERISRPIIDTEKIKTPCIGYSVRFYYLSKKLLKKAHDEAIRHCGDQIERVRRNIIEISQKSSWFKEYLNEEVFMNIINMIVPYSMYIFLILPLHFCLLKYYEVSRYPEGVIPEEDLENTKDAIPVLEEVISFVKEIIK